MHSQIPSKVKHLFSYNPDTGELVRLSHMGKRTVSGPRARCNIDGRLYLAHRIIWFLHHGKDPGDRLIDHIDGDPSNNKISNLRLSDKVANGMNRLGLHGVQRVKNYNSWRVSFRGKHYGYHHDFFDACCERKSLEARFWKNEPTRR